MELKDWILLIGTFVIGVITGVYLHFTIFIPEYVANEDLRELQEENAVTFVVTGEAYGGCQMLGSCPSFQITADRSYKYTPASAQGEVAEIVSGTLPRGLFGELSAAWEAGGPDVVARSIDPEMCTHFVDGIDYEYTIRDETGLHELDTCYTRLNDDSALAAALESVFGYLADPAQYQDDGEWRGVSGIIEDTLKETFDR